MNRKPIHTRRYEVNSFQRVDGLFDIEATLWDEKAYDFTKLNNEVHKAGVPIHHMTLKITTDIDGLIYHASVRHGAVPYGQECMDVAPFYKGLEGLHLLQKFIPTVREKFANIKGCTHITEMCSLLPTVFVQTTSGLRKYRESQSDKRPFQLNKCYSLRLDSEVVKEHYPQWYKKDEM